MNMAPSLDLEDNKRAGASSTSTEEACISRPTSEHDYRRPDAEKQDLENHDGEKDLNPLSTAVTTDSVIPPPPDGGLHAWLKVFGGFFIYVNIW
jgi:hypothetical protein